MECVADRTGVDADFSALRVIRPDAAQHEGGRGGGRIWAFGTGGHRRSFEIEETTLLRLMYRPASEPATFKPGPCGMPIMVLHRDQFARFAPAAATPAEEDPSAGSVWITGAGPPRPEVRGAI